ncbi:MAG TPA: DUF2809 domain-containing protein [Pseudolabrys sp.]
MKLRVIYAVLALAVIAAGLLWRSPEFHLPLAITKYGGSILWGALVYVSLRVVLPTASVGAVACLAAVLAAMVEFSQLLHWPWLDAFRSTRFGVLLIGRFFSWWDIASYWLGITVVSGIDFVVRSRCAKPPGN